MKEQVAKAIITVKPCDSIPRNVVRSAPEVGGLALSKDQQWYTVTGIRPASPEAEPVGNTETFTFYKKG